MPRTIDEQIAALTPLDAQTTARLAGYAQPKQFNDYRAKARVMPNARLEKLAVRLEELAERARNLKRRT